MMQISKRGFSANDKRQVERLRQDFSDKSCVLIPSFIEPNLLQDILHRVEKAGFTPQRHYLHGNRQEFGRDLTVRGNEIVLHQLHILLNDIDLFHVIRQITDCAEIGSFGCRIYKNLPENGHQLDWHDDTDIKERLIGVSINMSPNLYEGGIFQIRDRVTREILREVKSGKAGDAHIFRISRHLEHRVTPCKGKFPRIAAAGWFVSQPNVSEVLRGLFSAQ